MKTGFAPVWLAARDRYDVVALDREMLSTVRAWAEQQPVGPPLRVVDLGCGTGAGLRRALSWLADRPIAAYAVDRDADLLRRLALGDSGAMLAGRDAEPDAERDAASSIVVPVVADLLGPLDAAGGPTDGTLDLVVSHAVADLLPLDRFARRVASLLRPGGHAHLALTYDGETRFSPSDDPALDTRVIAAYHRHMDLAREYEPTHGGSTAGRRLAAALTAAGLEVVRAAPSVWEVRASDGPDGRAVLDGLIGFVVRSLAELGDSLGVELGRWEQARRAALDAGELRATVRHLDVLARRPERSTPHVAATGR
ncbi:MAG: class I SAM-dependent methyltransferase [Chloroflexota bacterium]|nr:class I SAM-dependent methyltransferase [Chloroflexota bacterium]